MKYLPPVFCSLPILLAMAAISFENANAEEPMKFVIAIHGGAGGEPTSPERAEAKLAGLRQALAAGRDVLSQGGTALDAVQQAIIVLEDSPVFNAGKGSVLNTAGHCELDSSIMDGRDLSAGAVAGVTTVKNPILLARQVMDQTPHLLLAGQGAEEFARRAKVDLVDPSYFHTEYQRARWEAAQQKKQNSGTNRQGEPSGQSTSHAPYLGTVGCVALDRQGNLAAGTSTGGTYDKLPGRIGDSPIIGAGL